MDRIVITGGRPLKGCVRIGGAKNAALPIMASCLLGGGDCVIGNVPRVRDVATMNALLSLLGVSVRMEGTQLILNASAVTQTAAPYELVKTMRASVLVLGPLLARFGEAEVSLPGGCAIGTRPVNLHLKGLAALGADIRLEYGYIRARAPRLRGGCIDFDLPTVTGTENLMMAACLAKGTTVIRNAAREPEIVDLARFLTKRGARIYGAGTDTITIEGVERLHGAEHRVIPDRIEAGTYLMAGAITGGEVHVRECEALHLGTVLSKLREVGVEIREEPQAVTAVGPRRLQAVEVKTLAYPGFPTDLQAQIMAVMCLANGTSVVTETIFDARFLHVPELQRMGACIEVESASAVIRGVASLTGAPVMASDLRASAGLVLAGLAAQGQTEISRVYHLDRGYEQLEEKLSSLGGDVRRVAGAA
ncbi:MAG: UDP-N-acetylglucosamine 1-carboxyvinyltransferase [Nitrospirae bacterium]|nr:MAG: UDP-N-acetylglucosamine 1-carboxyvinyltransferase [Nitrospirota bacterium]